MDKYEKKPVKFYEFSNQVGLTTVGDRQLQFCDHVQKIEGKYFATAFYDGTHVDGKDDTGIYYKKIGNADLCFVPLDMLEQAAPVVDDMGQTADMLVRLKKTITELNAQEVNQRAA